MQYVGQLNEVEMSDDKQAKAKEKRIAPRPPTALEPVVPAPLEPEPMAALPALIPREPRARPDKFLSACRATLASIGQSQTAVVSDVTAMALEIGGQTRANLTAAGDSVAALLKARSLVDAVEIQLAFARRNLEAMVAGSTRLGEIGLRLANDAAKPMLGRFAG